MKGLFLILNFILIFSIQNAEAQLGGNWVDLEGKVISKALEAPIEATLTLESLPYGADIRVFHSDEETGDFSFKIKENKAYKIKVESKGYISLEEEIKIEDENNPVVFSLMPSGEGTILRLDINFKQSKAEILEESYKELDKLMQMLKEYPNMEIQLEGHTDFRGSASANMRLSEKRVNAVKSYLTSKSVDAKRIKTKAFGGTMPLSRENTEEAKLNNRRVEARILKTE
ncbi:OmpA family protein [Marivirga arenosa]|uniref:OmpA family protein n=1 Tax=Marivirga arenosa TaxID=3059076 RepID=A0AA51N792_9BACT|nr:OmpA family protein [Marivirga sp. ABR2-2]WMN07601.1 OmpA family protein [Marivirga sp. ABR2-2]